MKKDSEEKKESEDQALDYFGKVAKDIQKVILSFLGIDSATKFSRASKDLHKLVSEEYKPRIDKVDDIESFKLAVTWKEWQAASPEVLEKAKNLFGTDILKVVFHEDLIGFVMPYKEKNYESSEDREKLERKEFENYNKVLASNYKHLVPGFVPGPHGQTEVWIISDDPKLLNDLDIHPSPAPKI